jgi:hypothetical protein
MEKMKSKKLYEFTGYRKYAIVVAADSEAQATGALEALGDTWSDEADDIGFCGAEDLDLVEVRKNDFRSHNIADGAHVVVTSTVTEPQRINGALFVPAATIAAEQEP